MDYISALRVLKASRVINPSGLERMFYDFLDKEGVPFLDLSVRSDYDLLTDDPEDGDKKIYLTLVYDDRGEAKRVLPIVKRAFPKADVGLFDIGLPDVNIQVVMKVSDLDRDMVEDAIKKG